MVSFPNCKINLGLNIINKRSDGFHNIETIFYPILLRDAIEIIESKNEFQKINNLDFSDSGLEIDGDSKNNLCVKAFQLIKKDFRELPPVQLHLHKAIPTGAGFGGGSADGSFTLQLINKKFNLGISENKLSEYALQLGSDCPFFLVNKPCFASGRGELLQSINLDLSAYKFLVVHPGIHINTAWAFSNVTPSPPLKSVKEIVQQPITNWKDELKNDFEEPVFLEFPEIKKVKEGLYNAGAEYASMSGSGSAVYGIFRKEETIPLTFPENYFVNELLC